MTEVKASDNRISRICSRDFLVLDQFYQCLPHLIMRQLPGKASKETRRMKRERKKGNSEGHQKMLTVALPVFLGLFVLLVAYVYTTASKHWCNGIFIKELRRRMKHGCSWLTVLKAQKDFWKISYLPYTDLYMWPWRAFHRHLNIRNF